MQERLRRAELARVEEIARRRLTIAVAASIVGTGELIQTTSLGAKAGFSLLWLILLSCVIKVFVQVELGRYAITHGKTTLAAFDSLPGPRVVHSVLPT